MYVCVYVHVWGMYICVYVLCILCPCVHVVCPTSRVRECDIIPLMSFMRDENLNHQEALTKAGWHSPHPQPASGPHITEVILPSTDDGDAASQRL